MQILLTRSQKFSCGRPGGGLRNLNVCEHPGKPAQLVCRLNSEKHRSCERLKGDLGEEEASVRQPSLRGATLRHRTMWQLA